jgi:hypothetical protein
MRTSKALITEKNQYFQGERARIPVSFPTPDTKKRHSMSGVFFCAFFMVGTLAVRADSILRE